MQLYGLIKPATYDNLYKFNVYTGTLSKFTTLAYTVLIF